MLINDWRRAWRLWSLRVCAAAAALYAFLLAAPEQAQAIWQQLPPELRELVPNHDRIALILFVAVGLARVLRQPERAA